MSDGNDLVGCGVHDYPPHEHCPSCKLVAELRAERDRARRERDAAEQRTVLVSLERGDAYRERDVALRDQLHNYNKWEAAVSRMIERTEERDEARAGRDRLREALASQVRDCPVPSHWNDGEPNTCADWCSTCKNSATARALLANTDPPTESETTDDQAD